MLSQNQPVLRYAEDFSNTNGKRLLERYATQAATFNDDIHGVAATTLAGIIAALPKTGGSVADHTYLIAGAGETGTGIGEMIAAYIAQTARIPVGPLYNLNPVQLESSRPIA